jgi:hypothetical protein
VERLTNILNQIVEAVGVMVRLVSVSEGIPVGSRAEVEESWRATQVDAENRMTLARSLLEAMEREQGDAWPETGWKLRKLVSRVRELATEAWLMWNARVGGSSCELNELEEELSEE